MSFEGINRDVATVYILQEVSGGYIIMIWLMIRVISIADILK